MGMVRKSPIRKSCRNDVDFILNAMNENKIQ